MSSATEDVAASADGSVAAVRACEVVADLGSRRVACFADVLASVAAGHPGTGAERSWRLAA